MDFWEFRLPGPELHDSEYQVYRDDYEPGSNEGPVIVPASTAAARKFF